MSTIARPLLHSVEEPDGKRHYTAEELMHFPSDWHYELIRGQLRRMDLLTGGKHGSYTARFSSALSGFIYSNGLGECYAAETGFLLARDPDTVKAPDFAFISTQRLPASDASSFVSVVPDIVLETRSPSDRGPAVAEKIGEWLNVGVRMALDLDPKRQTLTLYRPGAEPVLLGPEDTFEGGDVLPGFLLPLSRLFPPEV